MVQAIKLRIGNYYEPTDGGIESFKEVTADDLRAWSLGAIYGKEINITDEWLRKFGFEEKIQDGRYSFGLGLLEAVATGNPYNFFLTSKDSDDYCIIPVEIKYVHQLQNLYFALTGEELKHMIENKGWELRGNMKLDYQSPE